MKTAGEAARRRLVRARSQPAGAQGPTRSRFVSSLHDDLVAGRRMELEAMHGFVVRRAAGHGVPVPTSEAIYAILTPWAVRNQRNRR